MLLYGLQNILASTPPWRVKVDPDAIESKLLWIVVKHALESSVKSHSTYSIMFINTPCVTSVGCASNRRRARGNAWRVRHQFHRIPDVRNFRVAEDARESDRRSARGNAWRIGHLRRMLV